MRINFQDSRYFLKKEPYQIQIDGQKIDMTHIKDLTIDFDINNPYISGHLLLHLEKDVFEKYKFEGESKIQIVLADWNGVEFDNTFTAYQSEVIQLSQERIQAQFLFLDEFSIHAGNLYVSKGFKNISVDSILNDNAVLKPLYDKFNSKKKNFDNVSFRLDTYALPSNKSILNIQNDLKNYFNVLIYQTRKEYRLQKWDTLMNSPVLKGADGKDLTFKYPSANADYVYSVDDFNLHQTNTLNVSLQAPNIKAYYYDPLNKSKKTIIDYNHQKAVDDIGSDQKVSNISKGYKMAYQALLNPENQIKTLYQRNLYKNSNIDIIVKGSFSINPGNLVMLDYEGNSGTSDIISGKYVVMRVTDKIVQGAFTQRITLARPFVDK